MSRISVLDTSVEAAEEITRLITEAIQRHLKPPPKLDLVEWADTYRHLPDNSAEPGLWKTHRVEPCRQPMLSVSDPLCKEVTVMCCIQLMKTELMLNTALYYMHQEPSPIMYVAEKASMAEAWSKERLVKSVSATPVIADIFSGNRRGEGNTITQKQFPGGQISIVSANNPGDLAMRACRIMLFDEIDKYEANVGSGKGGEGGEGDALVIAWGRATTYGDRAKKVAACSPTIANKSRIEQEYFKSNMSVYIQPCKHCGHAKTLTWLDVQIPKNEKGEFDHTQAKIMCSECGTLWSEGDRLYSIRNGYWEATKPEVTWHHGYKVASLASPFTPVTTLAKEFKDAQGNPQSLKAFYNTRMAETWKEVGDQPDWERMYERRETYKTGTIPRGALLLTCGFDVQKDYLTWEIVGWGRKKESWSIDSGLIQGAISEDSTKEELAKFCDQMIANESGIHMPISRICIDSGYETQEVYAFCRDYGSQRVVPVKGAKDGALSTVLGTPTPVDVNLAGQRLSRGLLMWRVGTSVVKEQLYRWFNLKKPTDEGLAAGSGYPSGYCHFPEYDEEFFKQITAEQYRMVVDSRGFHTYSWEKVRKDNHKLDCRVYARAGASMLQIDRMTDSDWDELDERYHPTIVETETTENAYNDAGQNSKPEQSQRRIKRRKGWIKK